MLSPSLTYNASILNKYVGDPVCDVGNLLITYTLSVYLKEKLKLSDSSIHVFHSEVSNRSCRFLALNRKDQGYESKGAANYIATPGGQSYGDSSETWHFHFSLYAFVIYASTPIFGLVTGKWVTSEFVKMQ